MKVRTIQILTTPRGIIPAGQVLDIPGDLFRKLKEKGKVELISEEEENVTKKDQGWQGKMKELVDWFLNASLPETPFNLNPWTRVVSPSKFTPACGWILMWVRRGQEDAGGWKAISLTSRECCINEIKL